LTLPRRFKESDKIREKDKKYNTKRSLDWSGKSLEERLSVRDLTSYRSRENFLFSTVFDTKGIHTSEEPSIACFFSIMDDEIRKLVQMSFEAKKKAHCAYSNFPVGAALLCTDGTIYTGCNVECAVYPLGVCAEKTAICKAVSDGQKRFKAIVISSDLDSFIVPCGACRQFMVEFGVDWDCYMTKSDGSFLKMNMRELLPLCFTPESLLNEQRIPGSSYTSVQHVNGFTSHIVTPNGEMSS